MDRAQIEADIAARQKLCEAAATLANLTTPSREADIEVALALPRWTYGDRPCVFYNAGPYYDGGPDRIGLRFTDEEGGKTLPGNAADMLVPEFTSSYDAAYRLAGDETNRRIECGTYGNGSSWAYAHLAEHEEVCTDSVDAFNEPTAIAIALLHAHAARLEGQSREAA